jgi:hypothetical protein
VECPDPGELAEDRWNETSGDGFTFAGWINR